MATTLVSPPPTATGLALLVVLPLPSCPWKLFPQHATVPFAMSAQVWEPPAAMATGLNAPLTVTGVELGSVVPSPSCPLPFAPQQRIVPLARRAQECPSPPAETAETFESPSTSTGLLWSNWVPSPSCPKKFLPQHRTIPPADTAQACSLPADTPNIVLIKKPKIDTATGSCRSSWVPSPACPNPLIPQHLTVPSARSAQVCAAPAVMAVAWLSALTPTGR